MTSEVAVTLTVNGIQYTAQVEPRRSLADLLRHDIGLTGTKVGCEHGICGACTVLRDGQPLRSCLVFGVQAAGWAIRTVEALADGDALSELQQAFADHGGLQCGFCTPGFLMLCTAALEQETGTESVRELLSSNVCRCTGYQGIVDALTSVVEARRQRSAQGEGDGDR
jgi:aerobic-type carbon monoxide dehydrogenase small subunit (CoxS/CutS family)